MIGCLGDYQASWNITLMMPTLQQMKCSLAKCSIRRCGSNLSDRNFHFPSTLHSAKKLRKKVNNCSCFQLSMSLGCETFPPSFLAACTFRMIYYAIESEAFSQTLKRLIEEK